MRITKTSVSKMLLLIAIGLAVVAFTQSPAVSAKDQVTRPFKISGQMTFSSDYLSIIDQGVATHFGSFSNDGASYAGEYITANGDKVFWALLADDDQNPLTGTIIFTDGTGRFEGATGSFDYEMTYVGPGLCFAYTGVGTITY